MLIAIAAIIFLLQGIPAVPAQSGAVTGILKGTDGRPLAGVRIAAVPPVDPDGLEEAGAMSAIAETDNEGHYKLEGLPQGRYYIAAGRVDKPTYFPGTQELASAALVSVSPANTLSSIDFVMEETSTRPLTSFDVLTGPATMIPIDLRVDGGGKVPVFANGKSIYIRLASPSLLSPLTTPITGTFVSARPGINYTVTVENLPEDYSVESMTYGTTNLQTTLMTVSSSSGPPPISTPGIALVRSGAGAVVQAGSPVPPSSGPLPLSIMLKAGMRGRPADGVRVVGHAKDDAPRSIYISGVPGTYYADGSFEFYGVPPGKHVLATLDGTTPLGAFVVIGNTDVLGIELVDDAGVVPFDMRRPREPDPAGKFKPGTMLPLASVRGTVFEENSKERIPEGSIKITGYSRSETYTVDTEGRFEAPHLFPGTYTLDVEIFAHSRVSQTITVGSDDLVLELASRRLY